MQLQNPFAVRKSHRSGRGSYWILSNSKLVKLFGDRRGKKKTRRILLYCPAYARHRFKHLGTLTFGEPKEIAETDIGCFYISVISCDKVLCRFIRFL